jgi:hypothetical protein
MAGGAAADDDAFFLLLLADMHTMPTNQWNL